MTTPNDRDNEIFLLSALYFYYEYIVHKAVWNIIEEAQTRGTDWAVEELHKLPKKEEHVSFFVERILKNEVINQSLEHLQHEEVFSLLRSLLAMFDNQEFCAQCEAWSYFDAETAEEFALGTATTMLTLLSEAGRGLGVYTPVRVQWFEDIWNGQERYNILRNAVAEMMIKIKGNLKTLPLLAFEN